MAKKTRARLRLPARPGPSRYLRRLFRSPAASPQLVRKLSTSICACAASTASGATANARWYPSERDATARRNAGWASFNYQVTVVLPSAAHCQAHSAAGTYSLKLQVD